jgi:hypothetical protein
MTPAQIDAKLGAASSSTTDNVAQDIVSSLTISQIRTLPPRTIAILMQCLKETWFSANDKKAFDKLKNNIGMTIFYPTNALTEAIKILQGSAKTSTIAKKHVTASMIKRLYEAENKRMSFIEGGWMERTFASGASLGRGQLKQIAYKDVKQEYPNELQELMNRLQVSRFGDSWGCTKLTH